MYDDVPAQVSAVSVYNLLKLPSMLCDVGSGKNHKDAASVRTRHPIPAACGVYYFEIKVISKGRDG